MRRFIRDRIGDRTEIAIVLALGYGLSVATQLTRLAEGPLEQDVRLCVIEIILGGAILAFLSARGRRIDTADLRVSGGDLVAGVALWAAMMVAVWVVWAIVSTFSRAAEAIRFHGGASAGAIVLVAVVNPLFEESLHLGYLQQRLRSHGAAFAIGASVMARLAMHIYQGPAAVVSIVPLGVVFAGFHWRYQRIWPVVIAHAIADVLALAR